MQNNRGVALIIVLLVTALLIALVFEFAYGTRISMRAAINFRDSQRAYYLARSGVNGIGLLLSYDLKQNLPQNDLEQLDWTVPPIPLAADSELQVRWEDESGKINVSILTKGSDGYNRMSLLFDIQGISQETLDKISAWMMEQRKSFYLVTELRQFLSDEEFRKVKDFVTTIQTNTTNKININTAPAKVLQSLGLAASDANRIVELRKEQPYSDTSATGRKIDTAPGMTTTIHGWLTDTSNVFKIYSYAKVGGYVKQAEAVITRTATVFTVNYWRVL